MGTAEILMPASADDLIGFYDDSSDRRIRFHRAYATPGQPQCHLHKFLVIDTHLQHPFEREPISIC
jgi:hypothetical protein